MSKNTQLTIMNNLNVENIVFNKTINSKGVFNNRYVPLSIKNPDGSIGDLVIQTCPNLFSFGIIENRDKKSDTLEGYSFPLYLWNRNGCAPEEKEWTDKFDDIVSKCKEYILNNKQELGCWDIEKSDLKKIASCMWWKKNPSTGRIQEGTGPTLYVKLMSFRNDNGVRFVTNIYDADTDDPISPQDIIQKRCHVTAAIKIESIFIGSDNKIRLQVKMLESVIRLSETKQKRLLPSRMMNTVPSIEPIEQQDDNSIDELSDEEFVQKPARKTTKRPVAKVI